VAGFSSGKEGRGPESGQEKIRAKGGPAWGDEDGALAVAGYLADMTAQLESMARAAKLELLAYLLAMARAEADAVTRMPPDTGRDLGP
jgi:hypothetical protein